MRTEIRNNGIRDLTVIIAEEGKVFRRIGTNDIFGDEIVLGKSHYINGIKLQEPHIDIPEDFEEIDPPIEEESQEGEDFSNQY